MRIWGARFGMEILVAPCGFSPLLPQTHKTQQRQAGLQSPKGGGFRQKVYAPMGRFNWPNFYHHVHHTYTLNVQTHVVELARATYSSVHALVGACLVPWQLPNGARTNICFAEVPQYTIIHIRTFLDKNDTWTDRPFKGFAIWKRVCQTFRVDVCRENTMFHVMLSFNT